MSRFLWAGIVLVVLLGVFQFEHRQSVEDLPAYKAVCHGPPLHGEAIYKATREGYVVHPSFGCITKVSFEAITRGKAEWAAAHTPEAIARRNAELEERIAAGRARDEAHKREHLEVTIDSPASVTAMHPIDINTATETELASIIDSATVARIISERQKRAFSDWPDVVHRVVGLSAAQTAFRASVRGLTVNGDSLLGAAPTAEGR